MYWPFDAGVPGRKSVNYWQSAWVWMLGAWPLTIAM
jgi:hypothetical protein